MQKTKILGIAILAIIIFGITKACKNDDKTISETQLKQKLKDSILEAREKKIDFALTHLKDMIKKNMKNPDSYEMIARTWDKKDTTDVVKLLISFRGDNSFGGKSKSTVLANYNLKDETVVITKEMQD